MSAGYHALINLAHRYAQVHILYYMFHSKKFQISSNKICWSSGINQNQSTKFGKYDSGKLNLMPVFQQIFFTKNLKFL